MKVYFTSEGRVITAYDSTRMTTVAPTTPKGGGVLDVTLDRDVIASPHLYIVENGEIKKDESEREERPARETNPMAVAKLRAIGIKK